MVQGKKLLLSSLFVAASCFTFQSASQAFTETTDAGQTLATALNAGAATSFVGTIGSAQDADLYRFTIATAGTYTFSDVGGTKDTTLGGTNTLDTAIFLFSSTGTALVTDDDANGASVESTVTTTLTAGTYYFGISLSGNEPVNSSSQLLFNGYPAGDTTATRGAAPGLNPTTEATFNGQSYTTDLGTYNVTISAVPEPSAWAALALGGFASGVTILRRRAGRA